VVRHYFQRGIQANVLREGILLGVEFAGPSASRKFDTLLQRAERGACVRFGSCSCLVALRASSSSHHERSQFINSVKHRSFQNFELLVGEHIRPLPPIPKPPLADFQKRGSFLQSEKSGLQNAEPCLRHHGKSLLKFVFRWGQKIGAECAREMRGTLDLFWDSQEGTFGSALSARNGL
jgi:hypothetical protein